MNRTASHRLLISSANHVARSVFATLPWESRFSSVYLKLASTFGQQFGQTIYAAALYYGAEGMPPIKDTLASNFGPKEGEGLGAFVNRFLRNPVQRDYGYDFGQKFFNFCRKLMGEQAAGDLVMDLLEQALKPGSMIQKYLSTLPLKKIESIMFESAKNKFRDQKRTRKNRRTDGMPIDEEGAELDLKDVRTNPDQVPNQLVLKKLDEKLDDPGTRNRVEHAAQKLGPDLDTYFKLLMDGFEPRDIYNLRLLPSLQKDLPPEMRLDPSRPNPFESGEDRRRVPGEKSNKQKEKDFKEELSKYPNPMGSVTTFLKYHQSLMSELREVIEEEAN